MQQHPLRREDKLHTHGHCRLAGADHEAVDAVDAQAVPCSPPRTRPQFQTWTSILYVNALLPSCKLLGSAAAAPPTAIGAITCTHGQWKERRASGHRNLRQQPVLSRRTGCPGAPAPACPAVAHIHTHAMPYGILYMTGATLHATEQALVCSYVPISCNVQPSSVQQEQCDAKGSSSP